MTLAWRVFGWRKLASSFTQHFVLQPRLECDYTILLFVLFEERFALLICNSNNIGQDALPGDSTPAGIVLMSRGVASTEPSDDVRMLDSVKDAGSMTAEEVRVGVFTP